jgi:serine protease Do
MAQPMGFLVKSLHPASPAAKAGLKSGDIVVSVNGREVEDPEAFHYRITALTVGSTAELGIIRKGQKSMLRVEMIAPPESPPRNETLVTGRNPVEGANIENLSPAVAEEIGSPDTSRGVVVARVKDGSIAARMGIAVGDILVEINGAKITSVDDAAQTLKQQPAQWSLKIRRGDNEITMVLGG